MSHLLPCPECSRHVSASERACPFCEAALAPREAAAAPVGRLGRAAVMAFGAAVATGVTLAACGNGKPPADGSMVSDGGAPVPTGTTTSTATDTPDAAAVITPVPTDTVPVAKPYGAPPAPGRIV